MLRSPKIPMMMAAALVTAICSGCASDEQKFIAAQAQVALSKAPTILPDWPAYCRDRMPGVVPKPTEKWRWVQGRWEIVQKNENDRIDYCSSFYDAAKERAAGNPPK